MNLKEYLHDLHESDKHLNEAAFKLPKGKIVTNDVDEEEGFGDIKVVFKQNTHLGPIEITIEAHLDGFCCDDMSIDVKHLDMILGVKEYRKQFLPFLEYLSDDDSDACENLYELLLNYAK